MLPILRKPVNVAWGPDTVHRPPPVPPPAPDGLAGYTRQQHSPQMQRMIMLYLMRQQQMGMNPMFAGLLGH